LNAGRATGRWVFTDRTVSDLEVPAADNLESFRGSARIHIICTNWCILDFMGRTNIVINDDLVRKARKLTRLKTKREIVNRALELLVQLESRKGILRYYGRGLWKGDLEVMRRNRG